MIMHEVAHGGDQRCASAGRKADEDDSRGVVLADEHQPPEVLVLGEHDPPLARSARQELAIVGAASVLRDGEHVEPGRSEGANDREVAVLVGEEAERCRSHALFALRKTSCATVSAA